MPRDLLQEKDEVVVIVPWKDFYPGDVAVIVEVLPAAKLGDTRRWFRLQNNKTIDWSVVPEDAVESLYV